MTTLTIDIPDNNTEEVLAQLKKPGKSSNNYACRS
jgi:hypothetical protein